MFSRASIRCTGALVALGMVLAGCKSSGPGAPGIDAADGDDVGVDLSVPDGDDAIDGSADAPSSDNASSSDAPSEETADGAGEDSATDDREVCAEACAVAAAVVACPAPLATCMRACTRQFTQARCLPELRDLLRCQTAAGPDSYDCAATGPTMKPDVCMAEVKQYSDCQSGDAGT
jgi:hypothetical protein